MRRSPASWAVVLRLSVGSSREIETHMTRATEPKWRIAMQLLGDAGNVGDFAIPANNGTW